MQTEGDATGILGRISLLDIQDEPHDTSVLVHHVLRQKSGLLTRDNQLRLVGVEDEDTEIVVQQVVVQVLAQFIKIVHVRTRYQVIQGIQYTDVLLRTL